jgi:F-type H+-transporting ATPase subunit delta
MKVSIKKYAEALAQVLEKEKDPKEAKEKIRNLLKLLTKRKQGKLIKQLPEVFKKVWLRRKGQLEIKVTLPYKPTDQERLKIVKSLSEALKKDVILTTKTDEAVLGGMKIEFEDYIIDGTVLKNLEMLKTSLTNTN